MIHDENEQQCSQHSKEAQPKEREEEAEQEWLNPAKSGRKPGETITVLVDPNDPDCPYFPSGAKVGWAHGSPDSVPNQSASETLTRSALTR